MAEVGEAQDILKALGMPPAQHNQISGLTLLALCGLTPDAPWSAATRRPCTITKGIMEYVREHYAFEYAANTRENFRRQVLHQFVQGRVADHNPFEPDLPTNSPKAHYAITEDALKVVRLFGTRRWNSAVNDFRRRQGALVERYQREREHHQIPIRLPDGREINLSPGRHNEVQKAVVEEFASRFAPDAILLYLGDTSKKDLFVDKDELASLGISLSEHDKLPDVVIYDPERNWLFLIEAVTSRGPMSPKRVVELEQMLETCSADPVYISAFPDFAEFRKHMSAIAWETEIWLCDAPDHMIHYNGDRFLGPGKN